MKRAALGLLAMAAALAPAFSSASMLVGQSELVMGNGAEAMSLNIPSAGQLSLKLTDVDFTSSFSSLQFAVSDGKSDLVPLTNPGTLTLAISGPTTLYAHVFAKAQGRFDLGMYNFTANFQPSSAPVPLPGSGTLLGGMVLVLALLGMAPPILRRRVGVPPNGSEAVA